jgi:hypothetical protein
MRFRLKVITKNNGTVQYVPQVKMGFFKKWRPFFKGGKAFDTQVECLIVIEEFKVQVLDEEERVGYLKL